MFKKSTLMVCLSWSCLMMATPAMAEDDADCTTTPDGVTVCDETTPTQSSESSECDADADCSNGFTCQVVGAYDCAVPPPGEDGEPSSGGSCAGGGEIKMCVPPPPSACDPALASADCDAGLICVTYTFEECSGSGSDPSPICDADSEECDDTPDVSPECQSKAESVCVPKFLAPCQADADCGGGFKCVADQVCTDDCAAPSPGDGDGNERPSCQSSCEPSSQKYCQLQQVSCTADADCAQGLSCEEFSSPSSEICTVDGDEGSEPVCTSEPSSSESYCVPPDWQRWYGETSYDSDAPSSPRDSVANSTGNGGWKIVDAESAQSGATPGEPEADGGGCQSTGMGQSGSTAVLSLLGLFGLVGWRRRKRA